MSKALLITRPRYDVITTYFYEWSESVISMARNKRIPYYDTVRVMTHTEHVLLIKKAIPNAGGVWADLGSGEGAFTLALRDLAGENVEIFSIDQDNKRLEKQKKTFEGMFSNSNIHFINKDFIQPLDLPQLDGIIMANSLHYVENQEAFLKALQKYLKANAVVILVEYTLKKSSPPWVPYPVSFPKFKVLADEVGFHKTELLKRIPSSYWGEMYSAKTEL